MYHYDPEFPLLDKTGVHELLSRANDLEYFLEFYASLGVALVIIIFVFYCLYVILINFKRRRSDDNLSARTTGFVNTTISILTILTLVFTLFIQYKNTRFMIDYQNDSAKESKTSETKRHFIAMNNLYLKSLEINGGVKAMTPAIALLDRINLDIERNSKISERSFNDLNSIHAQFSPLARMFFTNIKLYMNKYNVYRAYIELNCDLSTYMSDSEEAHIFNSVASSLSKEEQIIFLMVSLYDGRIGFGTVSQMLYNGYFDEAYDYFSSRRGLSKFLSSRSQDFSSYHAWRKMRKPKPGDDFKSFIMGEMKEKKPNLNQVFVRSFCDQQIK